MGESFIDLETAFLVRRHVVESSSVVTRVQHRKRLGRAAAARFVEQIYSFVGPLLVTCASHRAP